MGEYVRVPRGWAQGLIAAGAGEVVCLHDLEIVSKALSEHRDEPVTLPERISAPGNGVQQFRSLYAVGWNACLDEIAKLGPLFSRPVQGEPVAWMDPRSPQMHATISNEVKQHNLKFGGAPASAVNGYTIPLYTRSDLGEVERLSAEVERLRSGFFQQVTDADLKQISDFVGDGDLPTKSFFLRPDAANLANMTMHMVREVQAARIKLAKRDALLRYLYDHNELSAGDDQRILDALSTSAEPSAKQEFREHLDKCAAEVESWPAWKLEALKHPSALIDLGPGICKGANCTSDGRTPHSHECRFEHARAVASGIKSITVVIDERAEFERAWDRRRTELKIKQRGNEFYRVQPNDLYRWHNVQDSWEMWKARAALERKP